MAVTDYTVLYQLTKSSGKFTIVNGTQQAGAYDFIDPGSGPDSGTLGPVGANETDLANVLQVNETSFTINGATGYKVAGFTADGSVVVDLSLSNGNHQFFLYTHTTGMSGQLPSLLQADVAICFLAGTQIATPAGERDIESLRIGDMITLADGSQKPVKWMGKMTVPLGRFNRHTATPILIRAGALGNGLPKRDLYTSYHHGFAMDGVLVIAGLLVNGTSIVQCSDWPESVVTYYQVEVEGHELMLAEGAATETFGEEGDNRSKFDNAEEFEALYPDAVPAEPMRLGRVVARRQIPRAVQERVDAAARELGYTSLAAAA
jgi:hypothetical protein